MSRRKLMQSFGALAFVLTPVARSMGYIAGGTFEGAPRFVMFFKGGSFHSPSTRPSSIDELAGTPLAPLAGHKSDLIVFQDMNIHSGSPKTDGYQEEHAAGLMGCVTGNSYHYSDNDAYYAYTDHQSFDVMLAREYKSRAELSNLPFSSLHIGAGAHSDADTVGLGLRYISFRDRESGDSQYGNAIAPIQSAGQVYASLMERIGLLCSSDSNQPQADTEKLRAALHHKKSLLDFRMADIEAAKRGLGMDSEHARKFDGLLEGWRQTERSVDTQLELLAQDGQSASAEVCPSSQTFDRDGENEKNLDQLSPVHDQMIDLIQLAFEWDLTRVVALTLSGASSGQRWPSAGVDEAHHSLEHSDNVEKLNVMGSYYSEKFSRLLSSLKNIDDGEGKTALYNSSVLLGMECWSDSSSGHYLHDIPFVLAGQGAGAIDTGRIVAADGRNNNDIFVSIQNAAGISSNTFGLDSLCRGAIV